MTTSKGHACEYCGRTYVVPSIARDCEAKHEADAA